MKILIAISIIQIAAILLLYNKVVEIDTSMNRRLAAEQDTIISGDLMRTRAPGNPIKSYSHANEYQLRQIIREELVAQLGDRSGPEPQTNPSIRPSPADQVGIENQRELIAQQLEYYASIGSISDSDMQKLQTDIAKLDDAGRTEMLRELTRALNSGRLEGQL